MIRQLNSVVTTPAASTPTNLLEMNNGNSAAKVAEVFLTAGHAFQKLGDLTLQLYSTPTDNEESKWSEKDVDRLRDALTRFAHELDNISVSVQSRITKLIKTDMKRRMANGDDLRSSSPTTGIPPAKRAAGVGQILNTQSLPGVKRTVSLLPGGSGISAVTSATSITSSSTQYTTIPAASGMPGISRGMTFSTSRPRFTPTTTPSVGATVTLQSTPQSVPGRTTKTVLVPAETTHFIAANPS
uniref:ENT domain-containing protein n=1 Tax=Syphacia muris TaxID=451379 RepID=A0A0N5AWK6_9BILA